MGEKIFCQKIRQVCQNAFYTTRKTNYPKKRIFLEVFFLKFSRPLKVKFGIFGAKCR